MATIGTTHTGSLPRPSHLRDLIVDREKSGVSPPELAAETAAAVERIVGLQADAGLTIVNDGEQGRASYSTYVTKRLTGFEPGKSEPRGQIDMERYPELANRSGRPGGLPATTDPACTGPITLVDSDAVRTDITNLKTAARAAGIADDQLFMSAASPGVVAHFCDNFYYPTREEYLAALVDVMRHEYREIVNAGMVLQLDCPDFAMSFNSRWRALSETEFLHEVGLMRDALNAATEGLPPEQMRMHVCWANSEAPHTHDIPLSSILDLVLDCRPAGISVEASNPRHAWEWQIFEDVKLPDDKYLIPGVLDTTTNFVEHPQLVAQRLLNYARLVGVERVVAGTDCGFGTFVGSGRVVEQVVWEKFRAMAEGAEIASAAMAR